MCFVPQNSDKTGLNIGALPFKGRHIQMGQFFLIDASYSMISLNFFTFLVTKIYLYKFSFKNRLEILYILSKR